MNDRLKTAITLIVAVALSFVVAETALRLVRPGGQAGLLIKRFAESERGKFTRYDPLLGWVGKPGAEDDFEWPDAKHLVKQNEYGFRGSAYPFGRTAKERLVVLGDSFTWGFGVEDDEIFTSIIERETKGRVEVVNLGVSGYGTDQEYLLWRELGHKWKPDRVLLLITFVTDIADNMDPKRYDYNKPFFVIKGDALELTNVPVPRNPAEKSARARGETSGPVTRLLSRSALVNALVSAALKVDAIRTHFESKGLVPKRQSGYEWEYLLYSPNFNATTKPAWDKLFKLTAAINADVNSGGSKLFVAVVPSIIEVYPELWAEYLKSPSLPDGIALDARAPIDRVAAWCAANSVGFIDLLPALAEEAKKDPYLYYPVNIHWTKRAHEIAAERIMSGVDMLNERHR